MDSLVVLSLLLVSVAALDLADLLPPPIEVNSTVFYRATPVAGYRITGGKNAVRGQFPFQAGLKLKTAKGTGFCGGVLISSQDILTAAHCCVGVEEIEVILGSIEIENEEEPERVSLTISKENIKTHEKWNRRRLVNDICILNLPQEVQFSDSIKPASLPKDDSLNYVGSYVFASGWGRFDDKNPATSPDLKFIRVKVIKNVVCNNRYIGRIRDTHMCTAGQGGKSTCSGDSGGPLVLDSDSTLVGLTSFGTSFGCAKGWPPVFTRVSKYLDWVKANMKTVEG